MGAGHVIIFDVDVKGGVNLKKYFGDKALSIFVQAPSVEALRERLVKEEPTPRRPSRSVSPRRPRR